MAQFSIPAITTLGAAGNSRNFNDKGVTRTGLGNITKLDDGDNADQEFKVDEMIEVTWVHHSGAAGGTYNAVYKGTIEWPTGSGNKYPVIEDESDWWIVGLRDDAGGITNAANILNAETFTVCFFPGTLIATPFGERKIEDLVPGDAVLVEDTDSVPATWLGRMERKFRRGFGRAVPVKWLGRQTVSTRFGPAERLMPVRFAAGSLGGGDPFCRIAT